jgi:hypothetical protein
VNLFSFPASPDSNLPPGRRALIRNAAAIEAISEKIRQRQSAKAALEVEAAKIPAAERDLAASLDLDAQTLLNRLRNGVAAALSAFGQRAGEIDERIAASRHQAAIARCAIATLDAEIEHLKGELTALQTNKPQLIAEAVAEAAESIVDGYAETLENLRTYMARLGGMERYLGATRHGRMIAIVPDFTQLEGFDTAPVVAPSREIAKAAKAFHAYAERLVHDPRTPLDQLVLPSIDPTPDEDTVYSDMSPIERARIDAEFRAPQMRQRPTPDSLDLARALEARNTA